MIIWLSRRRWILRAIKEFNEDSEEYKFLNRLQFMIKTLINLRYGVLFTE